MTDRAIGDPETSLELERLRAEADRLREALDAERGLRVPEYQAEILAGQSVLRSVFRATPVGITFNRNRVITSVNDAMCQLTGYGEAEMLGKSARLFYASDQEFEVVGRELYPSVIEAGGASVETRFRKKDGSTIFVVLTAALLRPEDPSAGHVVTVRDITQWRLALDALRASEDRFRRMVEQAPFSIQVLSPDGRTLDVNEAFEQLWGLTVESLAGYNILADRELDALGLTPQVRRAFAGERETTPVVEYDLGAALGRPRDPKFVQVDLYPVRDAAGAIYRIISIHRDMTERTRAAQEKARLQEQLQQAMKMEAVGRLAGGIAHDFNNLLTAIIGNIELARLDLPEEAETHYLDEVDKAAASAASLTRQLLAFSRRQIIEPKVLDLNDLVRRMQSMLSRLIGEDVALQVALGEGLGSVTVDPGAFEQVLVNLSVNARDAMPTGGRLLIETANVELDADYCALHPDARQGHHVMLAVSDTGTGMTDEVKRRVFEPFFTTKPKGVGTGLGLSTTFGAVKQAGGSIELYSEVGLGTTFRIYLPRTDEAPEALASSREAAADLPRAAQGETVLLVEDDPGVRELGRRMLMRLGYQVREATDGADALAMTAREPGPISLLMTDVVMPGMTGRDLAKALVASHPETKVLFTSGYTEEVIVHHGVLEADIHFIGKPYSMPSLARKVRETLDQP